MGAEGLQISTLDAALGRHRSRRRSPSQAAVTAAIAAAKANGATVELDLFPLHSQAFTGGAHCAPSTDPQGCGNTAEIQAVRRLDGGGRERVPDRAPVRRHERVQPAALRQPAVDTVGREPVGRDLRARARRRLRRAEGGRAPQNFVWGVGLSPRGNDNPNAASNSRPRRSPSSQDLGAWFKAFAAATGRTAPLMDGLDFHPYPIPQSLPFATGLRRPDERERLEPAPDLPGLLQRLQRLAAADDRPAGRRRPARLA